MFVSDYNRICSICTSFFTEVAIGQHAHRVFYLRILAGADQHRGDAIAAQHPCQRHLRRVAARRASIEAAHLVQPFGGQLLRLQEAAAAGGGNLAGCRAGSGRSAGRPPAARRRSTRRHAPPASPAAPSPARVPTYRILRLVDHARRAQPLQNVECLPRAFGRVVRQADIQRFAPAHQQIQRRHGFFQRRVRIRPVVIKDIHIPNPMRFRL